MKVWFLHDCLSGGNACFTTRQAMNEFIAKINLELVKDIGEGYCEDEYWTDYVEIDPNFEKWWNT